MQKIWLVRHGESMSQIDNSISGINPDLSPHGERQARQLSSCITSIESDIVLLSPLTRAWRTYQLSGYEATEVIYDGRLIESDWDITGLYDELDLTKLPDIAKKDSTITYSQPTQKRAESLLRFIENTPDTSFLLFGHWGIFMHLFNAFIGSSKENWITTISENTSISLLEIDNDGKRSVVYWNDASHLKTLTEDMG